MRDDAEPGHLRARPSAPGDDSETPRSEGKGIWEAETQKPSRNIPSKAIYLDDDEPFFTGVKGDARRIAVKKILDAQGTQIKNKWEMRKQLHAVNQKLGSDFMKAAMKAAGGHREGDPKIGEKRAGSTILRTAKKDAEVKDAIKRIVKERKSSCDETDDCVWNPRTSTINTAWAYVLKEPWNEEKFATVEDEVSYMRDNEVAVLWIQGEGPWKPENLKMTLQLVHMFEEWGAWVTISTPKKWKDRTYLPGQKEQNQWYNSPLQTVVQANYPALTNEAIVEAMGEADEDHEASFGSYTLHGMPRYMSGQKGDVATFIPSELAPGIHL